MNTAELRARLVNGLTTYDRRQSRQRHYNPHALALYVGRIDDVLADVEAGAAVEAALRAAFCGAVLRAACRAAGVEPQSDDHSAVCYRPASDP